MIFRLLICALLGFGMMGCKSPYNKKDKAEKQPLKNQEGDTSLLAFVGRLRIAVAKKDLPMLASMMTGDFGYRWDAAPEGENVFTYWDRNNLWPELSAILKERFVPNDNFMVAPAQVVADPNYRGFRAGLRLVGGSWKFAYFVPGEGVQ